VNLEIMPGSAAKRRERVNAELRHPPVKFR
jgi:hypothetical protein